MYAIRSYYADISGVGIGQRRSSHGGAGIMGRRSDDLDLTALWADPVAQYRTWLYGR